MGGAADTLYMYIVQHNGGRLILESDNEVPNFLIHFPAMHMCTCVCVCLFMIGELKEKKLSTHLSLVYVFTIVLVPIDTVHMYPCTHCDGGGGGNDGNNVYFTDTRL